MGRFCSFRRLHWKTKLVCASDFDSGVGLGYHDARNSPAAAQHQIVFFQVWASPLSNNPFENSLFMASTWASPFWTIIAVTRWGCMTANRKPTDEPMSERYSAYEERFSFSVNFSVTVANRS